MILNAGVGTASDAAIAMEIGAEKEGANYVGMGQINPTTYKLITTPPLGLEPLRKAASKLRKSPSLPLEESSTKI